MDGAVRAFVVERPFAGRPLLDRDRRGLRHGRDLAVHHPARGDDHRRAPTPPADPDARRRPPRPPSGTARQRLRARVAVRRRPRAWGDMRRKRRFLVSQVMLLAILSVAGIWWSYFALWLLPQATWLFMVT